MKPTNYLPAFEELAEALSVHFHDADLDFSESFAARKARDAAWSAKMIDATTRRGLMLILRADNRPTVLAWPLENPPKNPNKRGKRRKAIPSLRLSLDTMTHDEAAEAIARAYANEWSHARPYDAPPARDAATAQA